jgi:hypothetical protein
MQPLVANVPTMLVGGKHEIEPQAEDQIFVSYSSRFVFPSEESGSSSSVYYSFNAGGIHFVILNPYTYYDKSCKASNLLIFFLLLILIPLGFALAFALFNKKIMQSNMKVITNTNGMIFLL